MDIKSILFDVLDAQCLGVHNSRLQAVLDVAEGLANSQSMSLSAIGKHLQSNTTIKHKIKKVDRCLGNKHLPGELSELYGGLSYFVFEHTRYVSNREIVIDLCFLKDDRRVQMLSAQLCTKGRCLPLYHEVFKEGELQGRTASFLARLRALIPNNKAVVVIMDAGFHVEWFRLIEQSGWGWICRIRRGKAIRLSAKDDWISVKDFIVQVGAKTQEYRDCVLTREHEYTCRLVTTRRVGKGRTQTVSRNQKTNKIGGGSYSIAAKEPWLLATNLTSEQFKKVAIVLLYAKRMQIEETFRDIKSHQFGLSGRYVRTLDVNRWSVLMLMASIVIICYWVIGVIGHSQGMQRIFQHNTVKDRKVFSYFTLGKLIIEFNKLGLLKPSDQSLADIIQEELSRD